MGSRSSSLLLLDVVGGQRASTALAIPDLPPLSAYGLVDASIDRHVNSRSHGRSCFFKSSIQ